MSRQPNFDQMEDKREVRGLQYKDGEWTCLYFQPTLYCKHIRESLTADGWVLEETSEWFNGEGIHPQNKVIIGQLCEHYTEWKTFSRGITGRAERAYYDEKPPF